MEPQLIIINIISVFYHANLVSAPISKQRGDYHLFVVVVFFFQ